MASINEFKILKKKCRNYYDLLESELKNKFTLKDVDKERFGFYFFILEMICNEKDMSNIIPLITDTNFNTMLSCTGFEDQGVDAVYIDEEDFTINLFNFKYRENYNADKEQSLNESYITTKFINAISTEKIDGLNGKLKDYAEQIIERINSKEIWKFKFYIVSNENKELSVDIPELSSLKDMYDLEVITIGLDTISSMMTLRPSPIDAVIHIDKDSLLPFSESSLASSKSYVIKIGANELLRITCNNSEYRDNYRMEDYSILYDTDMDYNLLFDNVRGFVTKSKFNSNIITTLREEPSKFFMYNNGLTLTANDIIADTTNANKKLKIVIKGFQIVNGGQTIRSLHYFKKLNKDNIEKYLANCELLLRVFKTESESTTKNKIAEYTNSQNAISVIDLKSLSSEQLQIEQYLDENNIVYARKSGDTGVSQTKKYKYKISMEKFGQILFSVQGNPEKATNSKKLIFEKYYDKVFKEPNFDITKSAIYVNQYFEVKDIYESKKGYESNDQKIFYILYLKTLNSISNDKLIDFFEKVLTDYPEENLSDTRKMLQKNFREYVKGKINSI